MAEIVELPTSDNSAASDPMLPWSTLWPRADEVVARAT